MRNTITCTIGILTLFLLASCNPAPHTEIQMFDKWTPDQAFFSAESSGTYLHTAAGVRIHVPDGVEVNVQDRSKDAALVLTARATLIEQLDVPLGYGTENATRSMEALSRGEFGPDMDFLLTDSRSVVPLQKSTYGKSYVVLRRFEVCDITFDRILIFYHNGYQVEIGLNAQGSFLAKQMPQYFTTDPVNCSNVATGESGPGGKEDGPTTFYNDGRNGNASVDADQWFTTFDSIVKSIEFDS